MSIEDTSDDINDLLRTDYTYPEPTDPNFQSKIYKKREFYYHKLPDRPKMDKYQDVKAYRDKICESKDGLLEHQSFLSNFINPDTPYKGLLIFHGTGTGKTCAAIAIAERFKEMVQKYNTKIYVLTPGPLVRENWKQELLVCTGETYLKYEDNTSYISEVEKQKAEKAAINNALQYYKFMSYRSFYRKVLGEKILDKKITDDNKVKSSYRRTETGEYERDIAVDRLYHLNNSIIIVDEAHNLTGNSQGEALSRIIKSSVNLRVVLLTATPMKNLADDIIELLNFVRPPDSPILRDKIFSPEKNHEMKLRPDGPDYLKKMARGYVSYLRGADPLTFATQVNKGEIPEGLLFTKVVRCTMPPFQLKLYNNAIRDSDDALDRNSEAVANFAFPGLTDDKKGLTGYYGREGLMQIRNQLKTNSDLLNKKIQEMINASIKGRVEESDSWLRLTENNNSVTGKILDVRYLHLFSIKFFRAFRKLTRLVYGKKGARTAFVYSNLVKVGIELFKEILLQNGYLEFQENSSDYVIMDDTVCYFCGRQKKEHPVANVTYENENSTEYDKLTNKKMPEHTFHPATFITVTGNASEESLEVIPEDKQRILKSVFSSMDNKEGKFIKLVLGSKVMNEGISLLNVAEVHVLDVYFNLGRVEQVKGRAIRHCSHHKLMTEENPFPTVNVYKYAVRLDNGLSSEEELYRKAELKHILIKKIERILKETAIDCPLNRTGNIFPEEVIKHKGCGLEKGMKPCSSLCDYMECMFKCDDALLNNKYYDPNRDLYKKLNRMDIDMTTFTNSLAKNEIEYVKKRIKELYRTRYVYKLKKIVDYVKASYTDNKRELFDEFFVYKALDEMIPLTENDFNNYKDTVVDKYNRPGYIIFVDKYYIFQPFEQNENVPMYYRSSINKRIHNIIKLSNHMRQNTEFMKFKRSTEGAESSDNSKESTGYDFDGAMKYYDNRDEYKFVGIIDKETSRRKSKHPDDINDVFKIRERRSKVLEKRRGTGIPSLKGAVCATSKSKDYLAKILKSINLDYDDDETRIDTCTRIKNRLLEMEKYGRAKDKTNITYVMIPLNHPDYPFPYNLEDRVKSVIEKIKDTTSLKLDISVKDEKKSYTISIKNIPALDKHKSFMEDIGGSLEKSHWKIKIE